MRHRRNRMSYRSVQRCMVATMQLLLLTCVSCQGALHCCAPRHAHCTTSLPGRWGTVQPASHCLALHIPGQVSEAEAMAAGGITDILLTNEVIAPRKVARLAALAAAGVPIHFSAVVC